MTIWMTIWGKKVTINANPSSAAWQAAPQTNHRFVRFGQPASTDLLAAAAGAGTAAVLPSLFYKWCAEA